MFRGSFSMAYDQFAMFYLQSPIVAPQQGINVFGNLASNTPGFLANGGLQAPAGFNPNDPAQARAFTSTFYGNQQSSLRDGVQLLHSGQDLEEPCG